MEEATRDGGGGFIFFIVFVEGRRHRCGGEEER